MTRVLSGVVLGAAALALIWFLNSIALLGVALVVCALAFHEYERIVAGIGAKIPYWTTLVATLLACAMVPFQWVDIASILALALLVIAVNVLTSDRVGTPLLADTAAAILAPVYLGLPLGSLVGVHAIAGREGVVLLIATVAVSDTAQYYTGRTFGTDAALAAAQSQEDARGRVRRPRRLRRCFSRQRARTGCRSIHGGGSSASASALPPRASSAICSSRC